MDERWDGRGRIEWRVKWEDGEARRAKRGKERRGVEGGSVAQGVPWGGISEHQRRAVKRRGGEVRVSCNTMKDVGRRSAIRCVW